jgi:hypothetical protein
MQYVFLICTDQTAETSDDPADFDVDPWVEETSRRGTRIVGQRLRQPEDSTVVKRRRGEVIVSDGPFVETKDWIAGFDLIECKDLDEAIDIASKHPMSRFGQIEIRPVWPFGED